MCKYKKQQLTNKKKVHAQILKTTTDIYKKGDMHKYKKTTTDTYKKGTCADIKTTTDKYKKGTCVNIRKQQLINTKKVHVKI